MARRLKDFGDVRRYLPGLINRVEAGEVAPDMAGRCTYIANVLLLAIEGSQFADLERRLAAIEAGEVKG